MVSDAAALVLRELGGADVHAGVELHRVGVDDLCPELGGQCDGQLRFAGRGRSDNRQNG
jgi:hypothetical protein